MRNALLWLLAARAALADCCLHDRDSIATERAAAPGSYEAVFGAWPKHTREYYQRRLRQVADEAGKGGMTAALYDDKTVATARLGDLKQAVALLQEKEKAFPGEPGTLANLGTLRMWQERWDDAVAALSRLVDLHPAGEFALARYQLEAARFYQRTDGGLRAVPETLLGFSFEQKLGEGFRVTAPGGGDEREVETQRKHVLARLGLGADAFDALNDMLVEWPTEQAEAYLALGELLAAWGDPRLAWHSYQRALDLDHPRRVDLVRYQHDVLLNLDPDSRRDVTRARSWRTRRRALEWVDAYQRFERALIAKGGDPEDPKALEPFFREHPRP
ncbi:MAG: hypothetical protein HYU66_28565 [Armatimonadetes bacterium]|nr:hypothetical protein [Armatimonadota bacterium]